MKQRFELWKDTGGYAVVEATILFPIMMMIFAGLVLLAIYLPTRGVLQHATQYAATALATETGDTWLRYDAGSMRYKWVGSRSSLPNVYAALFSSFFTGDMQGKGEKIVRTMEEDGLVWRGGELNVECKVNNYIIYKEIIVTATRTIPMPVDLSFVKFPKEIPVTVSSTAIVQNGDEFVRNIDLAADFIGYLKKRYNGLSFLDKISGAMERAASFLGI